VTASDTASHNTLARAEAATERLATAVDAARDGIAILDADGCFAYVNAAHAAIYGFDSPAAMRGAHWSTLYGPQELARFEREIVPEIGRRGSWFGRAVGMRADGSTFSQEVALTGLDDGGLLCIVRDVSDRDALEQRLRAAEADYRSIFEQAAEGIYRSTGGGRFIRANPAMVALLGYRSEQELLQADPEISTAFYVHPGRREAILARLHETGRIHGWVSQVRRPGTGERMWISENAHCVRDDDGAVLHYEGTIEDITELIRSQRELAYSEQRFWDVLRAAGEFVWEADHRRHLEFISDRARNSLGFEPDELIGVDLLQLAVAEVRGELAGALPLEPEAAGPIEGLEAEFFDRGGNRVWLRLSAVPRYDDAATFTGWRGTGLEVTARRAAENRARYLAQHDELTGLPRRRVFAERLADALARTARRQTAVAVLFIDVDGFKGINDMFGHQVGDAVLTEVAERLAAPMRRSDLLARLSGDEFGAIMEDLTGTDEVTPLIQRLLDRFEPVFAIDGNELQVHASIGVFLAWDDAESADAVLNYADTAMYQAKQSGRGTFRFFDPELDAAARRRLAIASALQGALADAQFYLVFQPQFDLDSGRMQAAEALLRWEHPDLGVVSPAEFIPVAEQTGLIISIGEWVIDEVCRALANTDRADLCVFANVSAVQIAQADIMQVVMHALERHGVAPRRLGLEVTESTLMRCGPGEIEALHTLARQGVALALDDFGTGYSSLTYLRDFPASHLKLDMSFVQRSITSERDQRIVAATAELAHNLGLDTVAEGTETGEQVNAMAAAGCRCAQGFYYGKPLTLAAFTQSLAISAAE